MRVFIFTWLGMILAFSSVCASEWKEVKSAHFVIYHKNAPKDFLRNVENMAEKYYSEITRNLGFTRYKSWNWDERAKIYIYADAKDYVETAKAAQWSHGVASPSDKIIRTFPAAHGFFDSTLPHELGHIIFREFIGFKVAIPLWFEEGVAMYQEQAQRWGANQTVREAIKNGTFISLGDLTKMRLYSNTKKEVVNLFYAESASIVNYMITELGKHRFVRFCREIEEGNAFEYALKSVYVRFRNIDDLNKAWVKYLGK